VIRIVSYDSTPFPLYKADGVTTIDDAENNAIVLKRNPSSPGEYRSVLLRWQGSTWTWIG
jgi:hypothetical protein